MSTRSILFIDPARELSGLSHLMRDNGWELHDLSDERGLDQLPARQKPLIGLYGFAPSNLDDASPFEIIGDQLSVEWIGLTQNGFLDNRDHRHLLANYFLDYHTCPIEPDRLLQSIGHAHGMAGLKQIDNLPGLDGQSVIEEMVGVSASMVSLYQQIRKVASVDASVLISGESGTGKELIARAIHQRSQRRNGPFIAVNCGALPATLIQAELFGYEKGAFTGAQRRKIGLIESANQGTLLLDEIGDMPLEQQTNLLRFLQEKTIERIGSADSMPVDTRVVAASHVDLEQAVRQGRFREDLYYRLNVLHLEAPPLRERREDIELLAYYFFTMFRNKGMTRARGFSKSAVTAMTNYPWPGNVRELINRVRRAQVMCDKSLIKPEDLGLKGCRSLRSDVNSLGEVKNNAERELLTSTIAACNNNISLAARTLGVSRVTLYRMLNKHGLSPR